MLVYLSIFIAAILEGEIYYIAMCVAAGAGKLRWEGVLIAGALGGSAGDQFWFYLLARAHPLARPLPVDGPPSRRRRPSRQGQ